MPPVTRLSVGTLFAVSIVVCWCSHYSIIIPSVAESIREDILLALIAHVAATFFCTYEGVKSLLAERVFSEHSPLVHMAAASAGEVVSKSFKINMNGSVCTYIHSVGALPTPSDVLCGEGPL